MSRRRKPLALLCGSISLALVMVSGCSVPEDNEAQNPIDVSATPESPFPDTDAVDEMALDGRIRAAVDSAAGRGAAVQLALLDRTTGTFYSGGGDEQVETASVSKLFIADDVLFGADAARVPVAPDDLDAITSMLESSDDNAANTLWYKYGGSEIITRVAQRYGLTSTAPPWDGLWWNTETTPSDLVGYYSGLLNGSGGLSAYAQTTIIDLLRRSTPVATDGYRQHFGIADGLPGEPVRGVKQGWMCCIADRWIHLSTGIIGDDNRWILVLASREEIHYDSDTDNYPDTAVVDVTDDSSAQHARDTLTGVVTMMFPDGRIG